MTFIESSSTDPYFNLAMEEYVFEKMDKNEQYFILWQNDNTIVIGKHQNTAEEVNQAFVDAHNIHDSLQHIAKLAIQYNLAVITDEIYERILFDKAVHYSIASFPHMKERTLTLNGFSKTYSMELARELEEAALSDDYFKSRRLYPNVDFYSGIILRALGIPVNMKRPNRMRQVMGTTRGSAASVATLRPSTAESTEMAGVMTPSP